MAVQCGGDFGAAVSECVVLAGTGLFGVPLGREQALFLEPSQQGIEGVGLGGNACFGQRRQQRVAVLRQCCDQC